MRCLIWIMLGVLAMITLILFDWLNAREYAHDLLALLQHGVDVLSDWGDRLQDALGMAKETGDTAREALEKAHAVVEKLAD